MRPLIASVLAAGAIAVAVPVAAQAASAQAASGPTADMVLARQHITVGTSPRLTYVTSGAPAGSATYLEIRQAGPGNPWAEAQRLGTAGSVTAPAIRSGSYRLRVAITRAGRTIAASGSVSLVVRPAPHSSTPSWLPWLGKAALLLLGYLLA